MSPIVLVHGAYHGAWCWDKVVAGLKAQGREVVAIDLPGRGASTEPLGDLYQDAAAVKAVLASLSEPAIVVGHSYGGAVITEAVDDTSCVAHLVYISALVPNAGSCVFEDEAASALADAGILDVMIPHEDGGSTTLKLPEAAEMFYHD